MSSGAEILAAPVFSAGGRCFRWTEVIDAARVRGDWTTLRQHVIGLLAREEALGAGGGLPTADQIRKAGNDFRYARNLLSADELADWLGHYGITFDQWRDEMQRSLLDPVEHPIALPPDEIEQVCWVHAVCSAKLAHYALLLAQEVAVHMSQGPATSAPSEDELADLAQGHKHFCVARLSGPALAAEIDNNKLNWTRVDVRCLIHRNDMVIREAAMCVRVDGRDLDDVAADAGTTVRAVNLLLEDVDPALRTRLLAADAGDVVGPVTVAGDHWLMVVLRRVPPSLEDPALRDRAEELIIKRALESEVSRSVTWHEHF